MSVFDLFVEDSREMAVFSAVWRIRGHFYGLFGDCSSGDCECVPYLFKAHSAKKRAAVDCDGAGAWEAYRVFASVSFGRVTSFQGRWFGKEVCNEGTSNNQAGFGSSG